MISDAEKKVLEQKFDYFNKEKLNDLYPEFAEHMNEFRRKKGLPLLAMPTLITFLLGDAIDQTHDFAKEEKDKFHADFYISDFAVVLAGLNNLIVRKRMGD